MVPGNGISSLANSGRARRRCHFLEDQTMTTPKTFLTCALGLVSLGIVWQLATAEPADPAKPAAPAAPAPAEAAKPADATALLGGADRYLTHVSTDKPIYRLGDHVYVRGVILNATNNKPLTNPVPAAVEIIGPKGDVIASGAVQTEDSVLAFEWVVPDGQPGGEYKVKVTHPWMGGAPAERKFDIRAYRPPRLRSQI